MDPTQFHSQSEATGQAPNQGSGPGRQEFSWREPDQRYATRSRPEDLRVHRTQPQRDDPATADAITQGRRIYLGNLVYQARPGDVEAFLADNQFAEHERIHISVDPISGRNPGYCFIEFAERETAENAIAQLNGQVLMGREVKLPALPAQGRQQPPLRQPARSCG